MEGSGTNQHMFRREYFGKSLSTLCGGFLVVLTIAIDCFLLAKGMLSFTQFHHSVSEFIFSLIRAIGLILLGFGILQVGLSLKSHDPSQRANGMLTVAGGIVITFTKEILSLITG